MFIIIQLWVFLLYQLKFSDVRHFFCRDGWRTCNFYFTAIECALMYLMALYCVALPCNAMQYITWHYTSLHCTFIVSISLSYIFSFLLLLWNDLGFLGMTWNSSGQHGISWDNLGFFGRTWESSGRLRISQDNLGILGTT